MELYINSLVGALHIIFCSAYATQKIGQIFKGYLFWIDFWNNGLIYSSVNLIVQNMNHIDFF